MSSSNSKESRDRSNRREKLIQNAKKYENAVEGRDYVVCKLCGLKASQMSNHVRAAHKMTPQEYYKVFNCDKTALMSGSYLDQLTNRALTRNPSKDHGGKYSAHSPKFIKYIGLTTDEIERRIAAVKAYTTEKRIAVPSNTTLEYWLQRTDGNIEAATKLQSERQRTFSLDKCIEKYGEIDGHVRWMQRQNKWNDSLNSNRTGMSSKIADHLFAQLPVGPDVFTTTHNGEIGIYVTVANTVRKRSRPIKPDYVNTTTKHIIEFFGDYFHANPSVYTDHTKIYKRLGGKTGEEVNAADRVRIQACENAGYKVHIVWERDYCTNPQQEITKCLEFLQS